MQTVALHLDYYQYVCIGTHYNFPKLIRKISHNLSHHKTQVPIGLDIKVILTLPNMYDKFILVTVAYECYITDSYLYNRQITGLQVQFFHRRLTSQIYGWKYE